MTSSNRVMPVYIVSHAITITQFSDISSRSGSLVQPARPSYVQHNTLPIHYPIRIIAIPRHPPPLYTHAHSQCPSQTKAQTHPIPAQPNEKKKKTLPIDQNTPLSPTHPSPTSPQWIPISQKHQSTNSTAADPDNHLTTDPAGSPCVAWNNLTVNCPQTRAAGPHPIHAAKCEALHEHLPTSARARRLGRTLSWTASTLDA